MMSTVELDWAALQPTHDLTAYLSHWNRLAAWEHFHSSTRRSSSGRTSDLRTRNLERMSYYSARFQ